VKKVDWTVPKVLFIAGTRALLGVGAGLLVGEKLRRRRRRRLALTLITVGILTTIPAAWMIFGRSNPSDKKTTAAA